MLALQKLVRDVHFGEDLLRWVTRIVRASRPGEGVPDDIRKYVKWGAGPRASQYLILAAKTRAVLDGRFSPDIDDVRRVIGPVLRHRIVPNFNAEADGVTTMQIIDKLLNAQ